MRRGFRKALITTLARLPEFTFTVFHDRPSTTEICGDKGKQVVTLTREAGLNRCKCFALCFAATSHSLICSIAMPHPWAQCKYCTASPCFITRKFATSTCNAARVQPHFHRTALKEESSRLRFNIQIFVQQSKLA